MFFPDRIRFYCLFPPVALYQTFIITAEDPYGFPERSILEDHRKNKKQSPDPPTSAPAVPEAASDRVQQAEDLALKNAAALFGRELLKYLGISQHVSAVMPTEMVRLEVRHMYEDFNFQTIDGAWLHFEFESDALSLADLKRFREYEASTSRIYNAPVVTYVVCSSGVKKLRDSITEGINTYRVHLIRLKDENADEQLDFLSKNPKETLTREDVIPLLFAPLMSGRSKQKERILQCLEILKKAEAIFSKSDIRKMEAILYIFAVKFMDDNELKSIKEVIAMTKLGQMIWNDALEKGREEGEKIGLERGEQIGLERASERYSKLILILSKENKNDLIIKIASDPEYREELYKQYGL